MTPRFNFNRMPTQRCVSGPTRIVGKRERMLCAPSLQAMRPIWKKKKTEGGLESKMRKSLIPKLQVRASTDARV